ncbi:MAG: LCP family protein [Clostridia bacterium]|nr:LCP family protein [Clostridia bacterium]
MIRVWEMANAQFNGDSDSGFLYVEHGGKRYERRRDVDAILIAGLDKFESSAGKDSYVNNRQADFLLLMIIDHATKTCSAVHINRDTLAEITVLGIGGKKVGTVTAQLALSHTYGSGGADSGRNTARAVSHLLGITVDNYATLTMDAVATLNDLVGGVTLTVLDDFAGVDDTLKRGETVTLMGEHALNYVRARQGLSDSTNVARMERQRQYLTELYQATLSAMKEDEDFATDAVGELTDYIVSDFSMSALDDMLDAFCEYEFGGIYTLEGTVSQGEQYMEFRLNKDFAKGLMIELLYKERK